MEKDELTDAYAEKWGYGMKIKEYIQKGMIVGEKQKFKIKSL